jgi:hypothetical protein
MFMYRIYIDSFQNLLNKGMSYLGAYGQFNEADILSAVREEKRSCHPRKWDLSILCEEAMREERHERDMQRAFELWENSWTNLKPARLRTEVMAWQWRAPATGNRTEGRRFGSTNLAWVELSKRLATGSAELQYLQA